MLWQEIIETRTSISNTQQQWKKEQRKKKTKPTSEYQETTKGKKTIKKRICDWHVSSNQRQMKPLTG